MNKKHVSLLITSLLVASFSAASLASASPQICRELVNAAISSQTIPNSILATYGQDVKPCLASCGSLYGNGVDAGTLNSIAVCRKSLSSLSFDNLNYQSVTTQPASFSADFSTKPNANTKKPAITAPSTKLTVTPSVSKPVTNATTNTNDSQPTNKKDNQQTIRWF